MTFRRSGLAPALLLVLAASLARGSGGEESAAALRGETVYRKACAACHGDEGDGRGPAARYLEPRPRDLTSGMFKFRSTLDGEMPTDEDLERTLRRGIPRSAMPAFDGLLSNREITDVVAYVKTFSESFAQWGPGESITIPSEPGVTPASVAEGHNLYMMLQCGRCHGTGGKGDGVDTDLTDGWGNPIRPFDLTSGSFKGGKDGESLYRTLTTGLSGTPMPSYADVFLFSNPGEGILAGFRDVYPEADVNALRDYLSAQPDPDDLSEAEQEALVEWRTWALVHYVQTLSTDPGLFRWLFTGDPELEP